MYNQSLQEKLAWQAAYQLRACPDDTQLFSSKIKKSTPLSAHLAICSFCNERRQLGKNNRSALAEFSELVGARLQQPLKSVPMAGQVWTITTNLAGWGARNRYYNAPRILLLNAIENSKGFIAAQLFSEKALMGLGDVWLSDSFGFVETWNTYSVHADMLESCWGEVSKGVLTDVCSAADKDWKSSPDGSVMQSFRQMEVSVASFFSIKAVERLVAEYETAPELSIVLDWAFQKIKAFKLDLSLGDLDFLGQGLSIPAFARGTGDPKLPFLVTGMAVATGAPLSKVIHPDVTSKIASLNDDEAIKLLPIDHGQFKGDRYKFKFRNLSWISEEPLPVFVTVRGEVVENVQWEQWGTDETWLVLCNTSIYKEEKQTERTFLSISWTENGLNIDLLPKR